MVSVQCLAVALLLSVAIMAPAGADPSQANPAEASKGAEPVKVAGGPNVVIRATKSEEPPKVSGGPNVAKRASYARPQPDTYYGSPPLNAYYGGDEAYRSQYRPEGPTEYVPEGYGRSPSKGRGQYCNCGDTSVTCPECSHPPPCACSTVLGGNLIPCEGECVDPLTSRVCCGATVDPETQKLMPGVECRPGEVCKAGKCQCREEGQTWCNGKCGDASSDASGCGNECKACDTQAGETCENSVCKCPGTQVNCGGKCRDVHTDQELCGDDCDAAKPCPIEGQICVGGECGCGAEQIVCGDKCTDPYSDHQFCSPDGICGSPCPDNSDCVNGVCKCRDGFKECYVDDLLYCWFGIACPTCDPPKCTGTPSDDDPANCGKDQKDCKICTGGYTCINAKCVPCKGKKEECEDHTDCCSCKCVRDNPDNKDKKGKCEGRRFGSGGGNSCPRSSQRRSRAGTTPAKHAPVPKPA